MPNLKSAKKRLRQNLKRRARNKAIKTRVKTELRKVRDALLHHEPEKAAAHMPQATKVLYQAAAKGVIHRNTAARKISRLQKRLNAEFAARQAAQSSS